MWTKVHVAPFLFAMIAYAHVRLALWLVAQVILSELYSLSPREMEVARLVAMGWTNREIARELRISGQTVKNHLSSIYRKTGAAGRYDLGMIAVGRGWVDWEMCYREAEARAERNRHAEVW